MSEEPQKLPERLVTDEELAALFGAGQEGAPAVLVISPFVGDRERVGAALRSRGCPLRVAATPFGVELGDIGAPRCIVVAQEVLKKDPRAAGVITSKWPGVPVYVLCDDLGQEEEQHLRSFYRWLRSEVESLLAAQVTPSEGGALHVSSAGEDVASSGFLSEETDSHAEPPGEHRELLRFEEVLTQVSGVSHQQLFLLFSTSFPASPLPQGAVVTREPQGAFLIAFVGGHLRPTWEEVQSLVGEAQPSVAGAPDPQEELAVWIRRQSNFLALLRQVGCRGLYRACARTDNQSL